ncbi:MAG: NAD-dependent epimerase/dehydratase family protein [Fidelibacterota bacterium]
MRRPVILITGANGEVGRGLIVSLASENREKMVGLDTDPMDDGVSQHLLESIQGSVLDTNLLERIQAEYEISEIYHLAAVLSTRAEFSPLTAHDVNVGGTLNLLRLAMDEAASQERTVKFFFPSSIAVYGLGGLKNKNRIGRITEDQYRNPETMYGCNKLYCESLGIYFSRFYRRRAAGTLPGKIDFRSIRFPGLISATTLPSGGTSDFGPEMLHAAARKEPYSCFVREDTTMPFMTMTDAVGAIRSLMAAPADRLTRPVYHVTAFSPSAGAFRDKIISYFPNARIDFDINDKRQSIIDSWPADLNDGHARRDWGWKPQYDFDRAFEHYLIPEVQKRYDLNRP